MDHVTKQAGAFVSRFGDNTIKITGASEIGLAITAISIGYGIYKFLSNSSVNTDKMPDISVNVGGSPK